MVITRVDWLRGLFCATDAQAVRQAGVTACTVMGLSLLSTAANAALRGQEFVLAAPMASDQGSIVGGIIAPCILIVGFILFRTLPSWVLRYACWPTALLTLTVTLSFAVLAQDTGISGQLFFAFPSLCAAYSMYRPGAWAIFGMTTIMHAITLYLCDAGLNGTSDWITFTLVQATLVYGMSDVRASHRRTRACLVERTRRDDLTGLYNRQYVQACMPALTAPPTAASGDALLIMDIDHFKSINDAHGHPFGDHVLQRVAALLEAGLPRAAVPARVGGDELMAFIPGVTAQRATAIADHIVQVVASELLTTPAGQKAHVTCSVGVGHWPTDTARFDNLYAAADAGLYAAKRAGRAQAQRAVDTAPASGEPAVTPTR